MQREREMAPTAATSIKLKPRAIPKKLNTNPRAFPQKRANKAGSVNNEIATAFTNKRKNPSPLSLGLRHRDVFRDI